MRRLLLILSLFVLTSNLISEEIKFDYTIIKPSVVTAETPILFLFHGNGSNKEDLLGLKDYINKNQIIISMNAPVKRSGGGWSWFISEFNNGKNSYDLKHAKGTIRDVNKFMKLKIKELNNSGENIYALGFSQGAILIHSLIHSENTPLNAGLCLSARLILNQLSTKANFEKIAKTPLFISHGINDQAISINLARDTRKYYVKISKKVTYKEYNMGHTISSECLRDVNTWIEANISFQK